MQRKSGSDIFDRSSETKTVNAVEWMNVYIAFDDRLIAAFSTFAYPYF